MRRAVCRCQQQHRPDLLSFSYNKKLTISLQQIEHKFYCFAVRIKLEIRCGDLFVSEQPHLQHSVAGSRTQNRNKCSFYDAHLPIRLRESEAKFQSHYLSLH